MGLSYSRSDYVEPSSATASVQLVALGTRGRLCSIWYLTEVASASDELVFTLKDGSSSGSVIFKERLDEWLIGSIGSGNAPINLPSDGILFTNGLNAQASTPGMVSVTVTYIGEG